MRIDLQQMLAAIDSTSVQRVNSRSSATSLDVAGKSQKPRGHRLPASDTWTPAEVAKRGEQPYSIRKKLPVPEAAQLPVKITTPPDTTYPISLEPPKDELLPVGPEPPKYELFPISLEPPKNDLFPISLERPIDTQTPISQEPPINRLQPVEPLSPEFPIDGTSPENTLF